jgi:hypothetical protein
MLVTNSKDASKAEGALGAEPLHQSLFMEPAQPVQQD